MNLPRPGLDGRPAGATSQAVETVKPAAVRSGAVRKAFAAGAQAVRLDGDSRVSQLWSDLVADRDPRDQFWTNGVFTLAENHIGGETNVGDVLRFAPGQYGHLARKIITYPDDTTGVMKVFPRAFRNDCGRFEVPQATLRRAWDVALEVLESALPTLPDPSMCAVTVQLLKYPDSARVLERMFALIGDSAGRWTRVGCRVDAASAVACGPFGRPGMRGLFGWLSVAPVFGPWLHSVNRHFAGAPDRDGQAELPVGPAHTDDSRYLTMLAGERDVIRTEIRSGEGWAEIPLTATTLAIFPGGACRPQWGLQPTTHRYWIQRERRGGSRRSNLTLLVGIGPRRGVEVPE